MVRWHRESKSGILNGDQIVGKRKDTKFEAERAYFLCSATRFLNRISAFKAYLNFLGYDLIAANAENNSSARIQTKSEYYTNWGS